MLEPLWFALVAGMLTVYVVLDGFDLGAGAIHLWVARTESERRQVIASIGPVWDGNEVWLLAAGGTLFFAFPALYASSFSGFYLPLMIVLWLLMLRGIAIEFRGHLDSRVWTPFWDAVFCGASALLAVFFGVALGNVVRGVPLDASGYFFEPLWTNLRLGPETGVVDWYTVLVGLTALGALMLHGSRWVALKTDGPVRERAVATARPLWWMTLGLTALLTVATFGVQPHVPERLRGQPLGFIFPLLALGGLFGIRRLSRRGADLGAFLSSGAYLAGMMSSVAFGLYPYVLPSNADPTHALTVHGAAAASGGLAIGLTWWIPGMLLAIGYSVFVYRHFAGRVKSGEAGYGHSGEAPS